MKSPNHKLTNESAPTQRSEKSQHHNEQEEQEVDLYQPSGLQRQEIKVNNFSSFWDDLVKLLQLTIILVLIVLIFVMGYWIFAEVNQFWFTNDRIMKTDDAKLIELEKQQGNQISNGKNVDDEIMANAQNQEHQIEEALRGDQNVKLEIEDHQVQDENLRQQDLKDKTIKTLMPQKTQENSLPPKKSPSSLENTQVYDPVLIQLNKYRQKFPGYKQTIYTMKNTSITQAQYLRAKNLIELPEFYNPKEKKFIIKQNTLNKNCGTNDINCEKKQKYIDSIVAQQISYYEQKYHDSLAQISYELPFCIIVPSYKNNHENNIFRNLNSIFQQKYDNFHVVYIDDASKDGTPEVVRDYVKQYQIEDSKLLFFQNLQNQKALKNIYTAAHEHCKQKQIMIIVDGDDYMIGTQVLRFLNFQYQTKNLLAAYTNYLRINDPYYIKVGTSTPYQKYIISRRSFRKTPRMFRASHLRSYYVDLFRKIKPQDLKDENGQFFTAANDFAIMMPVLEMASPHFEYLPELTYLYDSGTGLNNFQSKKQVQEKNVKTVARRKMYNQIDWKQFYVQK